MLLALDVAYDDRARTALAAGIVFSAWSDEAPCGERVRACDRVAPYESGAFYLRELPCVLPLLEDLTAEFSVDTLIIDGYVDLGSRPGLGRHLIEGLRVRSKTPLPTVVGVAKSRFAGALAIEVVRGDSRQPLFVTTHGIDPNLAADHVRAMHGAYRVPTLLRRVDQLARGVVGI